MKREKRVLRCVCSQIISVKDVVQLGLYIRLREGNLLYIKYRCPSCHKYGERIIREDELEEDKKEVYSELTYEEKKKFQKMGKITYDEQLDFYLKLKNFVE